MSQAILTAPAASAAPNTLLAQGRRALGQLRQHGYDAVEAGGMLRVTPPMSEKLRVQVAPKKQQILAALRAEEAAVVAAKAVANGEAASWPPHYVFPVTWRQEEAIYRESIRQRLLRCRSEEAGAALRAMLAAPRPSSEEEWLCLGMVWRDREHELAEKGLLPDYAWPTAGVTTGP